jgi:hypothetical protein
LTDLLLKRAATSRSGGDWNEDDYDVLADGDVVGRIYKANAAPVHKEVLEFDRIEAVSDPMRELIEDLWPELVHKLPPKRPQG